MLVLGPEDYRLGEPLDILGQVALTKLGGDDTGGAVAVLHVTAPKMSGPPMHRHSREDEWFYVIDGELTFEVDGKRSVAGAGASAFAPRGTVHTFQNFRDEPAHFLVMVTPAGMERMFEEFTTLNKGLSQPDIPGVTQIMQNYGLELMGPPLG
ncbi:MAG TPA: cupin domain-containing protein [Terracidiphilus sp.]